MGTKTPAEIIIWDEIKGECDLHQSEDNGTEIWLTRGDDEELKKELLKIEYEIAGIDMEEDDDNPWEITNITHTPNTTVVEHRDDRNHLGITLIIWN